MPKEGFKLKVLTFLISGGLFIYSFFTYNTLTTWLSVTFWIITLFLMFFFRDPERTSPQGEKLILAPSYGKIIAIEKIPAVDFLVRLKIPRTAAVLISYLSVLVVIVLLVLPLIPFFILLKKK